MQHREHGGELFPGSPMLSAVYNSTPAAHLWKLDFCAPGEIFFSSGRRVARRDGFRLCHGPPIQPLEMHCPFLVQTVAFPSPLTLLRRAPRSENPSSALLSLAIFYVRSFPCNSNELHFRRGYGKIYLFRRLSRINMKIIFTRLNSTKVISFSTRS